MADRRAPMRPLVLDAATRADGRAAAMTSEAAVQQAVRLEYARRGYKLFRNNSGAMTRTERTIITQAMVGTVRDVAPIGPDARPVRFGLGNDSAKLNEQLKSSDLIGWRPLVIDAAMLGQTIALFVSLECKPSGWHLTPGDQRGQAQRRWIELVKADGGEAAFVTGL